MVNSGVRNEHRGGTNLERYPCNVSQSVDFGQSNNPNATPTKDYKKVQVVVYLCGVQRGCAEEGGERIVGV